MTALTFAMSVGSSADATPFKHIVLNRCIGREVGSSSQRGWNWTGIDLQAGDGRPNRYSGTSSPTILVRHAQFLHDRGGRARVILVEKDPENVISLKEIYGTNRLVTIIEGDASNPEVVPDEWQANDAVFVFHDPNNIDQFVLTRRHYDRLPPLTTSISTLGCNPDGLKRLPTDRRAIWWEYVRTIIDALPVHQDALVVKLEGSAQWAYLISGPVVWRDRYVDDARRVAQKLGARLQIAWISQEAEFNRIVQGLLLTKKEIAEMGGTLF